MLRSIYIDNYALIEKLELELGSGLSIITGETGAGKSILLGALGLLLGKRADTSMLKNTSGKCIAEAIFNLDGYGLELFFEDNEIDYQEETIIRREISSTGKSRAFVNDSPVNLSILQELSLQLIDIHSQHQSLSLNKEDYTLWIIDAYAGVKKEVIELEGLYIKYLDLKRAYQKAQKAFDQDQQNLDYMTHQFNELKAANLTTNELNELEKQASLLSHTDEIKSALESSEILLSGEGTGVVSAMKSILDQLGRISKHYSAAEELHKRIESAYIELKDIDYELINHKEGMEYDPQKMEQVNQRIDLLHTLLNKFKLNSEDELISLRDQLDDKLQQFAFGDHELEKMQGDLNKKETELKQKSDKLSESRKGVFKDFNKKIQQLLQNLGMKNAQFSIVHQTAEIGPKGVDKVQFFFSANSNIPEQNIAKVASGGELSRLMLAIKYLISGASGLPTIIFDEIDTGVSGEIANKVGNLIMDMAAKMQVVNITHLPQVASKGNQHYQVYKENFNGSTRTLIRKLNKNERLKEIARLLSGDSVTEAAIANAKVLLGF